MKQSPDSGWLPFLRIIFGFLLLLVIAILAAAIALGKVEQASSHGLDNLLGSIGTLAGLFGGWAFGSTNKKDEEN